MYVPIGQYLFFGPYTTLKSVENRSGVYVILDCVGGARYVLDIGEAEHLVERLTDHDRIPAWRAASRGQVAVAVLYTPGLQQRGRKAIESIVRRQCSPVCASVR